MTKDEFLLKMNMADTFRRHGDNIEYYSGYMKGLRRHFHGAIFDNEAEYNHVMCLALINDRDESKAEQGRGYRDGFTGRDPETPMAN